ncbi:MULTISPECIES: TetR/AcrR family transcriptional regulator [unclassified Aureispira]|uniref:TetR/AcrR family transcriptional regulator n=1 Tax=unclassified Aureispira TaxID=2649989 RepID=UPI000698C981|nr:MULTISPECIES: TetR/AcrR family transcriptional regulator [unclassified Aureispira]WMX15351.1 TetR/AcrR family transcriptional regulator [Aureispira sp. CCB-E]
MDELTKILDASESLFKKYGIRSVTMMDIAKELGMSKKTLYVHIENKHDLVAKVMKRHIVKDKEACFSIENKAGNALDELLMFILYMQQQIDGMNPSIIYDLQKYHRPVWEMLDDFNRKYMLEIVVNNLKRGVEEGLYRENLNVSLISRLHISLMPILANDKLFPAKVFPTDQLHREFMRYHIHGIVSEKGRKLLKPILDNLDPTGEIY